MLIRKIKDKIMERKGQATPYQTLFTICFVIIMWPVGLGLLGSIGQDAKYNAKISSDKPIVLLSEKHMENLDKGQLEEKGYELFELRNSISNNGYEDYVYFIKKRNLENVNDKMRTVSSRKKMNSYDNDARIIAMNKIDNKYDNFFLPKRNAFDDVVEKAKENDYDIYSYDDQTFLFFNKHSRPKAFDENTSEVQKKTLISE